MTKIAKRTKKETAKADVAVKAPVEAKKATPKLTVKELQLQLEVKDQQLSDAISTIENLEKVINELAENKIKLMEDCQTYRDLYIKISNEVTALKGRGLIARIFNLEPNV